MKTFASWILSVLGTLFLVLTVAICLALLIPPLIGIQEVPVTDESMVPEIAPGSMVFLETVEPNILEKDDIVSYERAEGASWAASTSVITHRVISNDREDEELLTKGDANTSIDPQPVAYDDVLGKLMLSVPFFGNVALGLSTVAGKVAAFVWVALGLIMAIGGAKLRKPPPPEIKILYF